VWRRFGPQTALAGVDARFEPGELSVVTGPSGSGKSTLLALLAGLDVPDEGAVFLDGVEISLLDRGARAELRRERVSVVLQELRLPGFLTAREVVELGLAVRGVTGDDAGVRAREALASVELAEHADRPVGVLSSGQRERVVLARAFAARPAVVVADEPTARLDAATTLAVGELLASLAHRTGTTVVCATHDPLVVGIADREVQLRAPAAVASTS
jgi:putative ABC transport system ATP-binding protein